MTSSRPMSFLSVLLKLSTLAAAQSISESTIVTAGIHDSYIWAPLGVKTSTVGTVSAVTDDGTNTTSMTTIFDQDFVSNASQTLWSRTDTNEQGTVTIDLGITNLYVHEKSIPLREHILIQYVAAQSVSDTFQRHYKGDILRRP